MIRVVTRALEGQKKQPISAGLRVLGQAAECVGIARNVLEHVGCDHDVVVAAGERRLATFVRQRELGFVIGAHARIGTQSGHGAL